MALPAYLKPVEGGVLVAVKLQPRASVNGIAGPLGEELRVKVTAPPVDSAANEALVKFLAGKLDCPRGHIELLRGHTSRHKTVKIHGLTPEEVLRRLGT